MFLTLSGDMSIDTGSLGRVFYEAGEYCYVGSAMNGLESRISRHLSSEKKMRWHIDRLTVNAVNMEAYVSEGGDCVPECSMAETAEKSGMIAPVKGFGSSDCKCRAHLFRTSPGGRKKLVSVLDLKPY